MKTQSWKALSLFLLFSIVLPGCLGKKEEKKESTTMVADGRVLVEVSGKPALTERDFEDLLAQAAEADQQIKFMLEFMPEVTREQLFKAKKRGVIISEWAKSEGVRETEKYKKKFDQIVKSLYEALDNEHFLERHKAEVTDADVKKFYDEQKSKDPRLTISPAGVKSVAVSFESKDTAQKFLDKVAQKPKEFEKIAQAEKLQVRNFGVVNQESTVDAPVKAKILAMKAPSVELVQDGKKFWVVAALSKEQAAYHAFEDVKEGIRRLLMPQKIEVMYEAELPKIEQKLGIKQDENYLKELQQKREQREQEMQQKQQAAEAAAKEQTAKPAAA